MKRIIEKSFSFPVELVQDDKNHFGALHKKEKKMI